MSPKAFPHLLPAEGLIWTAFLAKHGTQWDRFDYDVRVGQGHPIPPGAPAFVVTMIRKLSKKRIDAVGWLGGMPTIFEVTPRLGRTTPGALKLYEYLFKLDFPQVPPPKLAAVGPRIDPDLALYMASEGITVYLVQGIVPV